MDSETKKKVVFAYSERIKAPRKLYPLSLMTALFPAVSHKSNVL